MVYDKLCMYCLADWLVFRHSLKLFQHEYLHLFGIKLMMNINVVHTTYT